MNSKAIEKIEKTKNKKNNPQIDKPKKKKSKKNKLLLSFFIMFLVGILILVTMLSINLYVTGSVINKILAEEKATSLNADCILVLGAGVLNNKNPSLMLEDRLLQGIRLYQNGASDRLLMSGDHGRNDYDEVKVMKQFAIDRGVTSEHIFMDHAGFSTYESLYRARDVFKAKKIIIVTQKYHLYRALYIADKLGIEAYGVASNPRKYAGQPIRDAREILARVKDFFNVIIKPEPTFLGKQISLRGNGNLTND